MRENNFMTWTIGGKNERTYFTNACAARGVARSHRNNGYAAKVFHIRVPV